MYFKGDFHIHSNFSDGKFSPNEIISMAQHNNVDIISITDHDTTAGLDLAIKLSNDLNLKFIPGIELSTIYNNEKIHVLGYFNNDSFKNIYFQNFLNEIKEYRIYRGEKIISNLKNFFDINLDYSKILSESNGTIARPLIAKEICKKYNYSFTYIFNNLIGDTCPAYIPNKQILLKDAISRLKSINSIVVLAHPILINKVPLDDVLKFNFDGIECIYPLNSKKDTDFFIKKAIEYNKIITGGSDFHGINKEDTIHGHCVGDVSLDKNNISIFLKKLKELSS